MSLYIRDDEVDALAKRVQKALKAPTKTEAVRIALQRELDRATRRLPLRERVRRHQDRAAAFGSLAPDFDDKAFLDEMWAD